MEDVIVRRNGESQKSIALDEVTVNLLTSAEYLESMTVEMPPGSEIPEEYEHEGEEVRIVLEGEIEVKVAGETYNLKEGDVMWHKSSASHKIKNPSDKRAIYFSVNLPPSIES
jgi:quercetin dioxygenase-like cupin family protein